MVWRRLGENVMTDLHGRILQLTLSRGYFVAFLCASLVSTIACAPSSDPKPPGRMILIGIDGASPRIVNLMMQQGRLPNLTRIARRGVRGALRSAIPIHSPRIWNTIATGKTPEQHGIATFSYVDRDGKHRLYTSVHRKARTLWSIASAAGLKVGVVNFWNTYPLEIVNGVMVSDHVLGKEIAGRRRTTGAVQTKTGDVIYPKGWNRRLGDRLKKKATPLPDFLSPFAGGKQLPRWVKRDELQRRFEEDGTLASMALEILQAENPDVMMVLLPGIDRVSHYLWGVMEPPDDYSPGLVPTPEGRAAGRAALFGYYAYADALIGVLTAGFGPDDLVMVVSDHGFEAGESMRRLTGVHKSIKAIYGILFARGPGIEPGSKVKDVSVNDVTPTLLKWLRLPIALDMAGKSATFVNADELHPIDTYDKLPLKFVNPPDLPSGVEDDIVEQLKSLGYIEDHR